MNIYVGNLSWNSTEEGLQAAFEAFGEVTSASIVSDRETGRSRGFGFVEMSDDDAAKKAIEALNDQDMDGRTLRVNEARPRENNTRGPRGPRRY